MRPCRSDTPAPIVSRTTAARSRRLRGDRAGDRPASQGAEAHASGLGRFARLATHAAFVVDDEVRDATRNDPQLLGEIQRCQCDSAAQGAGPDIRLAPIGKPEYASRAERDQRTELPRRIVVQQAEWRLGCVERAKREVRDHGRVLPAENSITGMRASATASRRMRIASDSSRCRCVGWFVTTVRSMPMRRGSGAKPGRSRRERTGAATGCRPICAHPDVWQSRHSSPRWARR